MQKVLLDGSTVVFVARLLAGEDKPSAINVFDLAMLVESVILHDEVIVLSTSSGPALELKAAIAPFGPSVRIEERKVGELLWEYVQRNDYDAYGHVRTSFDRTRGDDLRQTLDGARWLWKTFVSRSATDDADDSAPPEPPESDAAPDPYGANRDMYDDLFLANADQAYRRDIEDYAAILEDIYTHSSVKAPAGRLERSTRRMLGARERTLNPADKLRTAREVHVAYKSLPAYENPTLWDHSPFQQRLNGLPAHRSFWEGVVIRAHLYLIASSLIGAPYKADSLRWPICWKFFGAGDLSQIAVDENYVRLAEDFERKKIESFNEFVGRPAVLARLPLFLRSVLANSAKPSDIPEQTLAIRRSRAATRFREHMRELTTSMADGEIEPVLREIAVLGAALSKEYGVDRNEVIWSLLSAGAKTAAAGVAPDASIGLAKTATQSAKGLAAWHRQRKFALISKPLNEKKQAKTFEHEVTRLFGVGLSAWDLEILDRLQAYGRTH